jgi:hypothetical protein
MAVNTRHDEKDEADELALKHVGRRRHLDFVDYCAIVFVIGLAIYTYLTSNSFNKALNEAGLVVGVYTVVRVVNRAAGVYEGYVALQYRSKIINERLTEIESNLSSRIDSLERKADQ